MADTYTPYRWDRVRGFCTTEPPASLPDYLAASLTNAELTGQQALLKKRRVTTALSLTSGPSDIVRYLFNFVTSAGISELWAFSGNDGSAVVAHRRVSETWSSVSLIDTAANATANLPHCVVLNDKLFIAYDSSVNRLHLWDGTVVRRVGIGAVSAPSVANQGSGSYAAQVRYYKVQMAILSGANVVAASELSSATSFTPSGSGASARVTKPTTVDSATHWRVFGSSDNVTFYALNSYTAVATTTYDDSDDPDDYDDGELAPASGVNIPPPSAKYLASDGNRLLMAGTWESTASSGQTAPKSSRVWYTPVLGSSDIGDDERIPNSLEGDLKNWVDVGERDGDEITGMAGPIEGHIYVFKTKSIWILTPTGSVVTPYRARRLITHLGSRQQYGIAIGEIALGEPAVYFVGYAGGTGTLGPYRHSPSRGLEWLGKDIYGGVGMGSIAESAGFNFVAQWWPHRRQMCFAASFDWMFVLAPDMLELDGIYLRGGWVFNRYSLGSGGTPINDHKIRTICLEGETLMVGGNMSSNAAAICSLGDGTDDAGSAPVNPSVTSKAWMFGKNGRHKIMAENPIVDGYADVTATVAYRSDYDSDNQRSGSTPGSGSSVREAYKLESVEAADTRALQVVVSMTGASAGDTVEAVTIPYTVREAL